MAEHYGANTLKRQILRLARTTLETLKFSLLVLHSQKQRPYVLRWLESRRRNYFLEKPSPWLTFASIDFLQTQMKPDWKVFEYGSGGSTLFWLKHGVECVSIEHDTAWYQMIKNSAATYSKLDYRLVLPEPSLIAPQCYSEENFADPDCYVSADKDFQDKTFRQYASQIDEFPDGYFDLVVVDGRARPSCIKHSIPKVKVGGLLVVDNADRKYYLQKTQALVGTFAKYEFIGIIPGATFYSQTNIYQKPVL